MAYFDSLDSSQHHILLRVLSERDVPNGVFSFEKVEVTVGTSRIGLVLAHILTASWNTSYNLLLNCSALVPNDRIDDVDSRIIYSGSGWQQKVSPYLQTADPTIHQSRSAGDTATIRFEGKT